MEKDKVLSIKYATPETKTTHEIDQIQDITKHATAQQNQIPQAPESSERQKWNIKQKIESAERVVTKFIGDLFNELRSTEQPLPQKEAIENHEALSLLREYIQTDSNIPENEQVAILKFAQARYKVEIMTAQTKVCELIQALTSIFIEAKNEDPETAHNREITQTLICEDCQGPASFQSIADDHPPLQTIVQKFNYLFQERQTPYEKKLHQFIILSACTTLRKKLATEARKKKGPQSQPPKRAVRSKASPMKMTSIYATLVGTPGKQEPLSSSPLENIQLQALLGNFEVFLYQILEKAARTQPDSWIEETLQSMEDSFDDNLKPGERHQIRNDQPYLAQAIFSAHKTTTGNIRLNVSLLKKGVHGVRETFGVTRSHT